MYLHIFVWQVSRNFQASLHHLHLLHVNRSWSWSWKVDPRLTLSSDILQTTAWVFWTNLRVAKHLLSRWIWMILKALGQIFLSIAHPLQKTCHPLPAKKKVFHHLSHFNATSYPIHRAVGTNNPGSSRRCSSPWQDRNSSIAANLRGSSCGETQPQEWQQKLISNPRLQQFVHSDLKTHCFLLVTFFLFLVLFPICKNKLKILWTSLCSAFTLVSWQN